MGNEVLEAEENLVEETVGIVIPDEITPEAQTEMFVLGVEIEKERQNWDRSNIDPIDAPNKFFSEVWETFEKGRESSFEKRFDYAEAVANLKKLESSQQLQALVGIAFSKGPLDAIRICRELKDDSMQYQLQKVLMDYHDKRL
jgi:hypothetical protein